MGKEKPEIIVTRNLKTQKQLVNNQRWRAFKFKTADCLSVLVSIKKKEALSYILVKKDKLKS